MGRVKHLFAICQLFLKIAPYSHSFFHLALTNHLESVLLYDLGWVWGFIVLSLLPKHTSILVFAKIGAPSSLCADFPSFKVTNGMRCLSTTMRSSRCDSLGESQQREQGT